MRGRMGEISQRGWRARDVRMALRAVCFGIEIISDVGDGRGYGRRSGMGRTREGERERDLVAKLKNVVPLDTTTTTTTTTHRGVTKGAHRRGELV